MSDGLLMRFKSRGVRDVRSNREAGLRLIGLGIQPQGNAHLIEGQFDPVGMNLNSCDHGAEDCTQLLRIELLLQVPTTASYAFAVSAPHAGQSC